MSFQKKISTVEIRRQELINRELKELVVACIEDEETMTPREREFFIKNKTRILDEVPSRKFKKTQEIKYLCAPCCIQ